MTLRKPTRPYRFGQMAALLLLAGCGSAQADADADAAEPQAAAAQPRATEPAARPAAAPSPAAAKMPLRLGYYAVGPDCAAAMQDGNLGIVIDATHWQDIDGDYPLLPVEDLGGGQFKLGEAAETLRQTGENRFVVDEGREYERTLTWCAEKRPS